MSDNPYTPGQHAGMGNVEPRSHKRVIKRFAPLQLGKLLGVLYFGMSLIAVPIILIVSSMAPKGAGIPGIGLAIALPIIYGVLGFIGGIIVAFIYNVCAKFVGGIEVEVE